MSKTEKERVCETCYWMKIQERKPNETMAVCHVPVNPMPLWLKELLHPEPIQFREVPLNGSGCETWMEDPILKEVEPVEEIFKCEGTTTD